MAILLNNHGYGNESWRMELNRQMPNTPVRCFGEEFDKAEITYALVWNHPNGDLATYPNLRAVFSLGAGTEHLSEDPTLPDVPLVVLADPAVGRDMAAHALYWVMTYHRKYPIYRDQQKEHRWFRHNVRPTSDFSVGVMGLGRIGRLVATSLQRMGYKVSGWDRQLVELDGIDTVQRDDVTLFLAGADAIVNCLPLSAETHGLLDQTLFSKMKAGGFFINISRGATVDDGALIASLDRGHLARAALDVFSVEPLPKDHPFWGHAKIDLTPHVAGATHASTAVKVIIDNINLLERGEEPFPLFHRHI